MLLTRWPSPEWERCLGVAMELILLVNAVLKEVPKKLSGLVCGSSLLTINNSH
jgi:hypothetical protein